MRLVLVAGQHRNEQSAFLLAPLVADALRSLGHTVMLYTNPEVRMPLEVVKENYHAGKTMTEEQWEALIFGWEEQVCEKYMEFPVFCLHNYPRNPTLFESPEENATYLQLLSGTFPHLGVGENEAYPLLSFRNRSCSYENARMDGKRDG